MGYARGACRGWGWAGPLVDTHEGSSSLLGSSVAFFLRHTRHTWVSLHSLLGAARLLPTPLLPLIPVLPAPHGSECLLPPPAPWWGSWV